MDSIYSLLVSDYSQVLSAQQDALASIYDLLVITHEYKSARQELLTSIFNSSLIACEQFIPHVARAQHMSYLQNFSRHDALHVNFCKLGRELYRISSFVVLGILHMYCNYLVKRHTVNSKRFWLVPAMHATVMVINASLE